jgi:hypothetical protein
MMVAGGGIVFVIFGFLVIIYAIIIGAAYWLSGSTAAVIVGLIPFIGYGSLFAYEIWRRSTIREK